MRFLSLISLLSLAVAGSAQADNVPACPVPAGVIDVPFDQIPVAFQKALHDKVGNVAAPGQPFNATDVVDGTLPGSREIFAWNSGSRWVIVIEMGGRAYHDEVYAFDAGADSKRVKPVALNTRLRRDVCTRAKAALVAQ